MRSFSQPTTLHHMYLRVQIGYVLSLDGLLVARVVEFKIVVLFGKKATYDSPGNACIVP